MNDNVMISKQYIGHGHEVFLPLTFKQQGRYLNFAAWFMTNMSVI
jgi:hypothetical protein